MVGCTIHAWTVMGSVDVPSLNGLFWAAFLLVLNDPWTKFALLKPDVESNGKNFQEDKTGQNGHPKEQKTKLTYTAVPYPSTIKARIPWTFKLITALTLDNWLISYQPHDKTQPPPPHPKSRTSLFVSLTALQHASETLRAAVHDILLDLAAELMRSV
jgi:hypothetical protein